MKKIIVLLNICLIIVSCQESKTLLIDYFDKIQEYELKEIVKYPWNSIGHPDMIFSHEDYIILSEPKLDYLLSIYNMETQSFTRFLPKGEGPDELLDVQQIRSYKSDSLFCVKSTFSKDIFVYAFNSDSCLIRDEVSDRSILSFFYDNNKLICSQSGQHKRCSLHDIENKSTVEFGEDIVIENCSPNVVTSILTGICAGNTESKRVAWGSVYGDVFEIYDYENTENIKTIFSVKGILPVITDPKMLVFSLETKLGISSIVVTDKYIYLLYNENQLKNAIDKRDDVFLSNKILIYDWNGIPQKVLKTNELIRYMSYNDKYKTIYCIGYNNNGDGKIYYIDDLDNL
ncbi:MAG: TolB-like 6-bladed beta-propeller domain-containing protein [Prevotellaceae bacterium]|jgi:hypothetical protein|nr:TolB-like 6-bladed beta-propeller domain-containing protein [Prevotellaceae bacterium]